MMSDTKSRGVSPVLVLAMVGGAALFQAGCLEDMPASEPAGDEVSALAEAPVDQALELLDPARAAVITKTKLAALDGAVPQAASCGTAGSTATQVREDDAPASGAANQRSGSSTGCAAVGALQPTDDALYFCFTLGNDGFTWTYLQNLRTGVRGWVRDNLLDNFGAFNSCPGL